MRTSGMKDRGYTSTKEYLHQISKWFTKPTFLEMYANYPSIFDDVAALEDDSSAFITGSPHFGRSTRAQALHAIAMFSVFTG